MALLDTAGCCFLHVFYILREVAEKMETEVCVQQL